MKKNFSSLCAAVSIYLAISFSLILSLVCYTIESCHLSALACRADSISYLSLDSLFANFCLPVFEKYGIFVLNEQGIDTESMLSTYIKNNCDGSPSYLLGYSSLLTTGLNSVDISDTHYITDNDACDFVNQVCEHITYLELTNLAEELMSTASTDSPEAFAQTEDGCVDFNFNSVDSQQLLSYVPNDMILNGETDEDLSNIDTDDFVSSVSSSIGHFIEKSLLTLILKDPSTVSTLSIVKAEMPSVTSQLTQDGINALNGYQKQGSSSTYEKACFSEYITYLFGNYLEPKDNTALKYQMEYVISGSADDDTNLINASLQLIALRTGFNLIHLVSDNSKFNAAWKIAQSTSSIPLAPYIVQTILLTVWATAEAILDVRDLLSGKSVPLIKTKEHWTLSIQGLSNFSKNTTSVNDGSSGLSYVRYLELLIFMQNNISTYYRTLDLIQMDICKEYNADFRISQCVIGIDVDITYNLPYLITRGFLTYTHHTNYHYK